jgi:hypothetical protein
MRINNRRNVATCACASVHVPACPSRFTAKIKRDGVFPYSGSVLISYNNRPADGSIPQLEEVVAPAAKVSPLNLDLCFPDLNDPLHHCSQLHVHTHLSPILTSILCARIINLDAMCLSSPSFYDLGTKLSTTPRNPLSHSPSSNSPNSNPKR